MTRPYDAALKDLIEGHPADWLAFVGPPVAATVSVIDADVSTISAVADKVLRVEAAEPWLLHIELQSSPTTELAGRLQWYNTLLRYRHGIPVRTALVLLRRSANSAQWNGLFQDRLPGEGPYLEFRYPVIRMWQVPTASILTGGVGTLPLAPLGDVPEERLPEVVQQVAQRLRGEASPEEARELWHTAFILSGLRLNRAAMISLFRGVSTMGSILEDSSAYEIWMNLAKRDALREIVLDLGRDRFGPPSAEVEAAIKAINEVERLKRMSTRAFHVGSWDELLSTP